MPLGVPVVSFGLYGPARELGTGRFIKGNILAQAGADVEVQGVGRDYENLLGKLFAAKHGRTGETEQSISGELVNESDVAGWNVSIAGNIGFVINPLPPHVIELSMQGTGALSLGNPMTGPFHNRRTNFYSPFGPRVSVEWFQGSIMGGQSYGPDPQWYQEAQPILDAEGLVALNKVGAWVANIWGADGAVTTRWAGSL